MKVHVAMREDSKTFCGRAVTSVLCTDEYDVATCKVCHRSDDRRVREEYRREVREGLHNDI